MENTDQAIVVSAGTQAKGAALLPTRTPLSAKAQRADLARIVRRRKPS